MRDVTREPGRGRRPDLVGLIGLALVGLALAGGLSAGGCAEDKCTTGEGCPKACPPGQAGLCVARGICECVIGGPMGGAGGSEMGVDTNCRAPVVGELLINEVMSDGVGRDEDTEYIEIVNRADEAVNLAGLKIIEVGVARPKISFQASCLPARGVAAIFRSPDLTLTDPPAGLIYDIGGASLTLPNTKDYQLVLQSGDGALLDQFAVPTALVSAGVSVNRSPDFIGPDIVRHDTLVPEGASPGACANGGRYVTGCIPGVVELDGGPDGDVGSPLACDPPLPGRLVLNEVLVDGEEGGSAETDEFVEIVNTHLEPVSLTGLTIRRNGMNPNVTFTGGCLPALGAVAVRRGTQETWIFAPIPNPLPTGTSSLRLANSADNTLELFNPEGELLSSIHVPVRLVKEGVSANRDPDLSGEVIARHEDLFGGVRQSPARCPDGVTTYAEGCPAVEVPDQGDLGPDQGDMDPVAPDDGPLPCDPPAPGDLVLNEALIDGLVPSTETDEFVELVNTSERAVQLDGLRILAGRPDREPVVFYTLDRGCMPPLGAAALRRGVTDSEWFPVPDVAPREAAPYRSSLANGILWTFRLLQGEVLLSELVAQDRRVDGVSLNRVPDLTGAETQRHDQAFPDPGLLSSPARCPDGTRYSARCR